MMLLAASDFSRIITYIQDFLGINGLWDVIRIIIDVGIISYIFYKLMFVLKDSRAYQVIKGIILILVLSFVAEQLQLTTVSYIIKAFIGVLPFLLLLLFQPELRRWLEGLGHSKVTGIFSSNSSSVDVDAMIAEVVHAAVAMSSQRVGALIVFERQTSLGEIIRTGTVVDAKVSTQLLRLIFVPNTPLHDGAVIIRGGKVHAAACYLPLTDNINLDKDLGTRHRAGIGVTESTDCISIIVSEETGNISFARAGQLVRPVTAEKLRKLLKDALLEEDTKKTKRTPAFFRKERNHER